MIDLIQCSHELVLKRFEVTGLKRVLFDLAAMFVMAGLFFYFDRSHFTEDMLGYRLTILMVAVHLLVALAPGIRNNNQKAFWWHNKSFLFAYLKASLFAILLYFGLAAALGLIQYFFFDINKNTWSETWLFCASLFHVSVFLSALPEFGTTESLDDLGNLFLEKLGRYLLLPLLVVYVVILYLYLIKILTTGALPKDSVASFVGAVCAYGILVDLLLYRFRIEQPTHFFSRFLKGYYFALFPLLGLHFWGLIHRINAYGMTENRYIMLISGVWVAIVALYMIVTRFQRIRFVPASLIVLLILSSFGPWSMFSMSERSQVNELLVLAKENNMLDENGMFKVAKPKEHILTQHDYYRFFNIIKHIEDMYGWQAVMPHLVPVEDRSYRRVMDGAYNVLKHILGEGPVYFEEDSGEFFLRSKYNIFSKIRMHDVRNYDYFVELDEVFGNSYGVVGGGSYDFRKKQDNRSQYFEIKEGDAEVKLSCCQNNKVQLTVNDETVAFDLKKYLEEKRDQEFAMHEILFNGKTFEATLIFGGYIKYVNDDAEIMELLHSQIFVRLKK